jgi:hypothetical protein
MGPSRGRVVVSATAFSVTALCLAAGCSSAAVRGSPARAESHEDPPRAAEPNAVQPNAVQPSAVEPAAAPLRSRSFVIAPGNRYLGVVVQGEQARLVMGGTHPFWSALDGREQAIAWPEERVATALCAGAGTFLLDCSNLHCTASGPLETSGSSWSFAVTVRDGDVRACASSDRPIALPLVYRSWGDYGSVATVLDPQRQTGDEHPVPHAEPGDWFAKTAIPTPSGGVLFGGAASRHRGWLLELGPSGEIRRDVALAMDGYRLVVALAPWREGWLALARATPAEAPSAHAPAWLTLIELDARLSVLRERVLDERTVSVTNLVRDDARLVFVANRPSVADESTFEPFLVQVRDDGTSCERPLAHVPAGGEVMDLVRAGRRWFVGTVTPRVELQSNAAHLAEIEVDPC